MRMVDVVYPRDEFMKLRRMVSYTIGDVFYQFAFFDNRLEKRIYRKGKEALVYAMDDRNYWVRLYEKV